ncbi:MAG: protein kinase [Deltaproteobacteria bacterium]|nr:protein kinase [Deltaproteobacteria bacterium]
MTPPPPPLGHIGRYELVSRLAVGGMGEVFLARVRGAGGFEKDVVIKRILPHLASDPGFVGRFIEEGKLVVRLRHANIAQVLDMGEQAGVFFIAMEHVDGKDLAELLRLARAMRRALPLPLVVFILSELLEALDYAHRATDAGGQPLGIIHRDVSPSNVMLSRTGEVKLLDFGIARAAERLQASTTGVIRGKYGYMSPQQAAGAELDPRSDLFSVGVVAWEMLAGARPFDGPSDLSTLDRVRFHDPGSLVAVAPHVPADLSAWVGRLLMKAPEERFATADEALAALRAHALERGEMARARDLAGWMEALLADLPPGLRGSGANGLSLDDVLRLGLPGPAPGPHTVEASPRTPSAPLALLPAAPPPPVSAPSVTPGAAVAPVTPLAAAAPTPVVEVAAPTTAVEPRRRSSFLTLLVLTNLVLIAVVLLLVLRPDEDAPEVVTPDAGAATRPLAAPSAAEVTAEVSAPTAAATSNATPAPDVSSPTIDVATSPVEAPVTAGVTFGGALGALTLSDEVEVTIRTTPAGAVVTAAGIGTLASPRKLWLRPGTVLRLRATAPDHQPLARTVTVEGEATVTLALEPIPRGMVKFRYLPANAQVLVDGRAVGKPGSNVLSLELAVGAHEVVIVAGEQRTSRRFEVKADETTNLGTLEL